MPLGSIRPEGWLKEMLVRQRDGISANLDETYPQVMGARNGWLGGDGDQWERGPYWIDGLLPMAYILDDDALKEKGYNPINQLVGYLLSEDPTYITTHNNARALIRKVDRDELMRALVKSYLNN